MTRKNLEKALKLNNEIIIQQINLLTDYVNALASDGEISEYQLNLTIQSINQNISNLNTLISDVNSDLSYRINSLNTSISNTISALNSDYVNHKSNNVIHVSQEDRNKWDANTGYTDEALRIHAENSNLHVTKNLQDKWNNHVDDLVIHVTQEDKDLWNSILQNAKNYAQELFNQVTSFNIIKCQSLPTTDIKTMTIYLLEIDPEQDDLFEEYMYIDNRWEKIGNTRIDLSDYVTKALLQSTVDSINQAINNLRTQLQNSISSLESKHDQDVQDINDDLNNNYKPKLHTHDNKQLLDALSADNNGNLLYNNNKVSDLTGYAKESDLHNHDNKNILDNLTQQVIDNSHSHNNKNILDNITQDIINSSHIHENQNVLDKFSENQKGELLYNNKNFSDTFEFTEADVTVLINTLWPETSKTNFLLYDNKYLYTADSKIFVAKEGGSS